MDQGNVVAGDAGAPHARWHWQERYGGADPVEAYRVQVLKVQKQISFARWIKMKQAERRRQPTSSDAPTADAGSKARDRGEDDVRGEAEFARWLEAKRDARRAARRKAKEEAQQASDERKPPRRNDQPFVKPPSLHVNPKRKRTASKPHTKTKKAAPNSVQKTPSRGKQKQLTAEQCAAVYAEWLKRKSLETRVNRKVERVNQQIRQQEQQTLHLTRWKKKEIVCAYSTNHAVPAKGAPVSGSRGTRVALHAA